VQLLTAVIFYIIIQKTTLKGTAPFGVCFGFRIENKEKKKNEK